MVWFIILHGSHHSSPAAAKCRCSSSRRGGGPGARRSGRRIADLLLPRPRPGELRAVAHDRGAEAAPRTGRRLCGALRVALPTVLVAYPVMLLFWPWAQESPIENPLRALIFFSHETFPYRTLFAGKYFPATDLPWAYLPTYIVLALPELLLVLILAAPVTALAAVRKLPRSQLRKLDAPARAPRLRHYLSGRLCRRDQGRAVRRHAPLHFPPAAHRRRGGAGLPPLSRLAIALRNSAGLSMPRSPSAAQRISR